MVPRAPQMPPKMDPKSTQNDPLERPGPPRWNKNPILLYWERFWRSIWSPLEPQNRPKIDTLRETCSKKRAVKAMFAWLAASPHFSLFFCHFWSKNDEKFSALPCFLPFFPILEKPCILQATLLVLSVFANLLKL